MQALRCLDFPQLKADLRFWSVVALVCCVDEKGAFIHPFFPDTPLSTQPDAPRPEIDWEEDALIKTFIFDVGVRSARRLPCS